ncbi:uncharacterized protein LOC123503152 [Portunus trituberculatus]|uniref:Uncharacterized protein n=1 Tax=Portunus trituberculatus TaxID=210409 RepID=A0A5B7EFK4_PORTR|nr:uncharacterized protein LOC123503152 [Portunus trituberculatus]MPC33160.1 hypothetical protein [Portunus trituberculatus]
MARRSARKVHAGLLHRFLGKESFMEFLKLQCIMTGSPRDVVKRVDLSRAYRRFCSARRLPAASMVNIGRHLGSQHVWASKRLGGANGRNQEYAYVGLSLKDAPDEVKEEQSSCPPTPATPATSPPPLPPSLFWEISQQQTVDWFSPSSKPLKISLSPTSSEDAMRLFDTFLQDHVECTGSAEDAVSIEELHKAYRRLCRSKGITPPSFSKLKTRCLTQRENVSISSISFQSVKRAYTGLRWTNSALQSLNPSRRVQPKPCSSCQAKNQAPAAPVVLCEMNQEGNDWIPLVRIDSTADQSSLRHWGDEDSSTFINTLVSPSTLLPAPASPPTPPETQDSSDLFQMLDMFDSTDLCMF